MLLVDYRKKYYILRGFSTALMLCNIMKKLNNGKLRHHDVRFASVSGAIVTRAVYVDNVLFINSL